MANYTFTAPVGMTQGTHRLPDGVVVTITAGQASVPDTSWQAAVSAGYAPPAGTPAPYVSMKAPANWTGNLALPNGVTVTVTGGLASVPQGWTSFASQHGFVLTHGVL